MCTSLARAILAAAILAAPVLLGPALAQQTQPSPKRVVPNDPSINPAADAARKAVRRSSAGSRSTHGTHSCRATPGPTAYALIAMAC